MHELLCMTLCAYLCIMYTHYSAIKFREAGHKNTATPPLRL